MTKTAADWCIESQAHDLVRLEEDLVRARNDAAIWRTLAHLSMWWLWAVLADNERLTWHGTPDDPTRDAFVFDPPVSDCIQVEAQP